MTEREILTIFRFCLESAILPVILIENWAECRLMKTGIIRDDYILHLCSANKIGINETVHILKQHESKIENPLIWKISLGIAGILYDAKKIDLKRACYFVNNLVIETNDKTEYEILGMSLDDAFYLAEQKIYGNLKEVEREFIEVTSEYKCLGLDFIIENFEDIRKNA